MKTPEKKTKEKKNIVAVAEGEERWERKKAQQEKCQSGQQKRANKWRENGGKNQM